MIEQPPQMFIRRAESPDSLRARTAVPDDIIFVEKIETFEALDTLRTAYESIYAGDPHRNVFVSWSWLRAYVESMAGTWCVLAARSMREHRYVGFCPLEIRRAAIGKLTLDTELFFAINPTADYTGIIMAQNLEQATSEAVTNAFASAIDAMPWDNFHVNNVIDPRVDRIVEHLCFRNDIEKQSTNPCRSIKLPPTWDLYLGEQQGYAARRRLRYTIRTLEHLPGFRFEEARAENLDACIDALLLLNHRRWQTNLVKAQKTYGELFRATFGRGACRIFVVWSGTIPVAAQAAFIDPERRSWGVYMLGYNPDYSRYSPGTGIVALTIQCAIEEEYAEYDFLRGDEAYKERFGSELRSLENWIIRRRGTRNRIVKTGRALYYRVKALARKVLLGKPLSTSAYVA